MSRSPEERIAHARRVVEAARRVRDRRASLRAELARSTGLGEAGVDLALDAHLEVDATDADLARLVASAGDAPHVTVILSANVFVAALRAIALAVAAAPRVVVRPSRRDPAFARALVRELADPAVTLDDVPRDAAEGTPDDAKDVASIAAGEIHVYGRDETIADVRARARAGVRVRGHGAGMGIALVGEDADLAGAAERLASDVVPFDQRGCLSPRVAFAYGGEARAREFAAALHASLASWQARVPRGALFEVAEARRWRDTMAVAGQLHAADDHAVAVAASATIPPPGRHVLVVPCASLDDARPHIAPLARFVVAVGASDPALAHAVVPAHARVSPLGAMQRPPLDGPVDRRSV
jgi:acyl-CoA reductase-like NAD-dependent aldehyde dehydrogenase